MAQTARKNLALTPATQDLGLGDQITQQLQDEEEERKKKLLKGQSDVLGSASMALLGKASGAI